MEFRIGIDVGGTFTDFLVVGSEGLRIVHKTSSTPEDPSIGVVTGLEEIAGDLSIPVETLIRDTGLIVHGTTVTTNAALTRTGAKTGLLVTEGFRDVLTLRDGLREETYNNRLQPPEPLAPRYLSLGVRERTRANGEAALPLDESSVRETVQIFEREGVEAVAISFLHSPLNPEHEQQTAALVRELMDDVYVTASNELLPQVRFYPRTSTTVLNAYVGPIIKRYMAALTARLEALAFDGILLIMQSNGGVASPLEVSERAALSLLSGPAASPAAGLAALSPHGMGDCLTVDMGGTSFDIALAKDGYPLVKTDGEIARWRLSLPMIDIHTIGAGGGSIASVDGGGLLRVGPQSAGADPGPVCYGRGGTLPTVTDADLVLGFLDAGRFHGDMRLDTDAAANAVVKHVGGPLGLDTVEAAAGVYDLVNVSMASGIREVTVRRGLDPRDFPLVIAGGAGGLHATAIAQELEIPLLIVPRESSIFCASGMLISDFKHDYVRPLKAPLSDLNGAAVESLLREMAGLGTSTLISERVTEDRITLKCGIDLRYVGQWHEITVPLEWARNDDSVNLARIVDDFHKQHDLMFGYSSSSSPVESLAVRLSAIGRTEKGTTPITGEKPTTDDAREALLGTRDMWSMNDREMVESDIYDGQQLAPNAHLKGPAAIQLPNTTIIVQSGFLAAVDQHGSFVVYSEEHGGPLAKRLVPDAIPIADPSR